MLRERRQAREDADRLEDERRRRRIAEADNARRELQAAAVDLARNVRRRSASPPVGRRNSQARARFADDDDDFDDEPRRWRPREASSPERMPAFQQTPPRPVPLVPAQPRNANDDDALTSCPKCQLSLLPLTPSGSEAHIRRCFDGGSAEGAHLENCPVCERSLVEPGWTKQMGEKHVDDCCKGLGAGGGGGGGGGGELLEEEEMEYKEGRSVEVGEIMLVSHLLHNLLLIQPRLMRERRFGNKQFSFATRNRYRKMIKLENHSR